MITPEELKNLEWGVTESVHDARPIWYRWRRFDENFRRDVFPVRLNIIWQMFSATDEGLPTQPEFDRMKVFEDRIVSALECDCHSILSLVITTNSKREYVFHSQDASAVIDRLIKMPQEEKRYPLEILQNEDIYWEYDDRVVAQALACY